MQNTRYSHHTRSSFAGPLFIVLLILAILSLVAFTLYRQQVDTLLRSLQPTCTVGVASATITVQAWSANNDCQLMTQGQDNFTGVNWLKLGATPVSQAGGNVSCEMDLSGRHVTVRDSSLNNSQGAVFCSMLNGGMLPPP